MTDLIEPTLYDEHEGPQRAKYGISPSDIICLHDYLGAVIVNGLRLMADNGHGWPGTEEFPTYESWANKLHEIADKLEQASTRDDQINKIYDEVQWGPEDEEICLDSEDFNDYLDRKTSTPAFKEYSRRTDEIDNLAIKNAKEALEWLGEHWMALWD